MPSELLNHLSLGWVLLQPGDRVVPALTNVVALVAIPGAFADHHTGLLGQVEQTAQGADATAKQDVEFGDPEGRGDFVFCHLHLGADAVLLGAPLEGLNPANVQAHRCIKLEGVTTGGGFRIAVGDTDLLAQLVEEDHGAAGFTDVAGDLAHGLAHQASLGTHSQVPHFTFNFSAGGQGRHRVDHHDVHGR